MEEAPYTLPPRGVLLEVSSNLVPSHSQHGEGSIGLVEDCDTQNDDERHR